MKNSKFSEIKIFSKMDLRSTIYFLKFIQKDALKSQKLDKEVQQTCQKLSCFSKKNKATIQLFNSEIQKVNKLFTNIISDQQIFSKIQEKGAFKFEET